MTGLGFLLVTGFLAFMYRNIRSITPIVPIIAIVGWNAVAMYLLGLDYNPMTACLGSMTIGVSSEYTILVMERYMEEKEKCGSTLQAIGNSVSKIGSAILASGLTTFFGFSALILSDFPIINNFGLTTIIAVLFSLIGAIVIMPALLSLIATMLPNSKADAPFVHSLFSDRGTGAVENSPVLRNTIRISPCRSRNSTALFLLRNYYMANTALVFSKWYY
jgi:predicted RND superfamily exporter protein